VPFHRLLVRRRTEDVLLRDRQVNIRGLLHRLRNGARKRPDQGQHETSAARFPYDVLVFPIVDWHDRFQRPQHLSVELAKMGARVFYFSNRFLPSLCIYDPKPRKVAPNVYWAMLPGSIYPPDIYADIPSELQVAAIAEGIQRVRDRCKVGAALAIVDYPFWAPIVRQVPNTVVVYDCMDAYASFANAGRPARELERETVMGADMVVCSSEHLCNSMRRYGRESVLVRNGVTVSHFEKRPQSLAFERRRPTVGYWGATAEWTDIALLIHAARELPGIDFVLIGEVMRVDVSELAALPNVRMIGEVPYCDLPAYLHGFDVCILPYRVCEYALASDPMKVWEYMSAGKPIVAVRLPEIERLHGLITLTSTREEFVEGIRRGVAENDPVLRERRIAYAHENSWDRRAGQLRAAVETYFPKVSIIVLAYNQRSFTKVCLDSIERFTHYPNIEIIVVNNGSADDTAKFLTRWSSTRPWTRVVMNESNLGFAAGNNRGARSATGEYLIFLNNDTFVTDGWVGDLLAHFRRHSKLGLLGPVTNRSGNESVIPIEYTNMEEMAVWARSYTASHRGKLTKPHVLHWFCVMVPRVVWEQVGELDEAFGVGLFEDDDYTYRVRALGYDVACAEDVFIHHHHSASFGELPPAVYDEMFARNRSYFESKWGPWQAPVFRKEMQAKCCR
jgi:GT2 family glycosyltransferase/glycosyltransferase involved in cell wall biosynthesis